MRVIRCEHEFVVHVHLFKHLLEIFSLRGFFHGLRAEPEMVADVFRRLPLEVRYLHTEFFPCCVQSPYQWWEPCESAFNEHNLECRKMIKYPFTDITDHLGMKGLWHTAVVLYVIGGPAGTCDGPLIASEMDTDG